LTRHAPQDQPPADAVPRRLSRAPAEAVPETSHEETNRHVEAIRLLLNQGSGEGRRDLVIITKGDLNGVQGGTNAMKIVRVVISWSTVALT
jgi:hypothetical protein